MRESLRPYTPPTHPTLRERRYPMPKVENTITVHFHVPEGKVNWFLWTLLSLFRSYTHGVEVGPTYYRKPSNGRMYFRHLGLGREPKFKVIVKSRDQRTMHDIGGLPTGVWNRFHNKGITDVQELASALKKSRSVSDVLEIELDRDLEGTIKALIAAEIIALK